MDGPFQSEDRRRDGLMVLLLLSKHYGKNFVSFLDLALELGTNVPTLRNIAFNLRSQDLLDITEDGHAHLNRNGAEAMKFALSHPEREVLGFPAANTLSRTFAVGQI
jgi:Mn-dependent DtxR family transcriptional regulator